MTATQQPEPTRLPIEERARRRRRIDQGGRDRYGNLLHTLRAGREVTLEPRTSGRLEWHPIARQLLILAIVVAALYVAATFGLRLWRSFQVDTWAGPDTSVTSGQRLEGCAPAAGLSNDTYPVWIRFNGAVYLLTDYSRPFGSDAGQNYQASGYRLGSLQAYRIAATPDGREGRAILLRYDGSDVGSVYSVQPDCG